MGIRLYHQVCVRTGGFPGGTSGKEPICQCSRYKIPGFDPWVRKIPGSGRSLGQEDPLEEGMATIPIFLPEESHGQRSLAVHGITKELDMTEVTEHICMLTFYSACHRAGA